MGIPILGDIFNGVKDIISEVVVDKDKKNQLEFEIDKLEAEAEVRVHEEVMGQIEINKIEAASGSLFVAGWRPFVGWVSGAGVAYTAVLQPFLSWVARVAGYDGVFPDVDTGVLMATLTGMLGIGGMRTYEKVKGVSTNDFRDTPSPKPSAKKVSEAPVAIPPKPSRREPHFKI